MLWKLEKVYLKGNYLPRLQEVSLEIGQGITAVMGSSGAGKTSLLNLLVGFEVPERGRVCPALPREGHPLPLYWVPQNAGLWPHLRAREHLEKVAPLGQGKNKVKAILSSFDIADKAESYPDQLSQGERSRLAAARALASGAAVLVMDEPLISVEQAGVGKYWQVIRGYLEEGGGSLIFATHSPKEVLAEADRVICLKEGRLLYEGGVEELYWRPASAELADCLGEGNWLLPDEAYIWLNQEEDGARCYRPEQISILGAETSPIIVKSSRFKGSVAEVELLHEKTGKTRRFYHRPAANHLRPGDHVLLKLIMSLLLAFSFFGCSNSEEPSIPVREIHHWQMPPDGLRIPAPRAVAVGKNNEVIVLDTAGRILVFDENGSVIRQWRMPASEVGNPEGVSVLKDGRLAVSDTHYHQIVFFDDEGKVLGKLGSLGKRPGEFLYPVAVAEDDQGNLYVCEYGGNDRIQKFSSEGAFLLSFGGFGTGRGEFQRPSGMVWYQGKIYVADAVNNRIQVFSSEGRFLQMLGRSDEPLSLHFPYDISLGADGALYVVEYGACRISRISLEGKLLGRFGGVGSGRGEFHTPWGIVVDAKMRILIADTGNRRIVELKI